MFFLIHWFCYNNQFVCRNSNQLLLYFHFASMHIQSVHITDTVASIECPVFQLFFDNNSMIASYCPNPS